jgi:hypothetical protein
MRGDGQNQLEISAPHPLTDTHRLKPLLAALISLDSPFNFLKELEEGFSKFLTHHIFSVQS